MNGTPECLTSTAAAVKYECDGNSMEYTKRLSVSLSVRLTLRVRYCIQYVQSRTTRKEHRCSFLVVLGTVQYNEMLSFVRMIQGLPWDY